MEHFVLTGCFTTRLFSRQDHRNPRDAPPEKCQHCTNRIQEGKEIFSHLLSEVPPGPLPVGAAGAVLLLCLGWHYSLGTCLCFSHFAAVFLTLCFYRRVLQRVWGKWPHQPSVQSASHRKLPSKKLLKIHFWWLFSIWRNSSASKPVKSHKELPIQTSEHT